VTVTAPVKFWKNDAVQMYDTFLVPLHLADHLQDCSERGSDGPWCVQVYFDCSEGVCKPMERLLGDPIDEIRI
jgi:hypothetical protein